MTSQIVRVDDVAVTYGTGPASVFALRGLTLEFRAGEVTLVMGPSGSGKTTLLTILGCLLSPTRGAVNLLGHDPAAMSENERTRFRLRNVGFVFQAFRLIRSLSAIENVSVALEIARVPRREARERARRALAELGLSSRERLRPDELSGGEKQRVAIARALANGPRLILADEPTASLDSESGLAIVETLRALSREERRTVVVVSHDPRLAERADRVVKLRDGAIDSDVKNAGTGSPSA